MSRIYVASSWRNPYQAQTVKALRALGHEVYDFKSDAPGYFGGPQPTAFSWSEMSADWQAWGPAEYRNELLTHPRAASGYLGDLRGMEWADTCLMLLPCGRSAHIEAGYMKGRGKRLIIMYADQCREGFEPDLMYLLADNIIIGEAEFGGVFGFA